MRTASTGTSGGRRSARSRSTPAGRRASSRRRRSSSSACVDRRFTSVRVTHVSRGIYTVDNDGGDGQAGERPNGRVGSERRHRELVVLLRLAVGAGGRRTPL